MNALALFAVGFAVTLIVLAALTLLVYGAVLDGRDEQAYKDTEAAAAGPAAPVMPVAPVAPVTPVTALRRSTPVVRIPTTEGEAA